MTKSQSPCSTRAHNPNRCEVAGLKTQRRYVRQLTGTPTTPRRSTRSTPSPRPRAALQPSTSRRPRSRRALNGAPSSSSRSQPFRESRPSPPVLCLSAGSGRRRCCRRFNASVVRHRQLLVGIREAVAHCCSTSPWTTRYPIVSRNPRGIAEKRATTHAPSTHGQGHHRTDDHRARHDHGRRLRSVSRSAPTRNDQDDRAGGWQQRSWSTR